MRIQSLVLFNTVIDEPKEVVRNTDRQEKIKTVSSLFTKSESIFKKTESSFMRVDQYWVLHVTNRQIVRSLGISQTGKQSIFHRRLGVRNGFCIDWKKHKKTAKSYEKFCVELDRFFIFSVKTWKSICYHVNHALKLLSESIQVSQKWRRRKFYMAQRGLFEKDPVDLIRKKLKETG